MNAKAPDTEPEGLDNDPPKGESNGYAKARCGYEFSGENADKRAESHAARCRLCKKLAEDLMAPVHTPSKGAARGGYDPDSDPEAVELERQAHHKMLQNRIDGGPSRPHDNGNPPAWAQDIIRRLDRIEDGRGESETTRLLRQIDERLCDSRAAPQANSDALGKAFAELSSNLTELTVERRRDDAAGPSRDSQIVSTQLTALQSQLAKLESTQREKDLVSGLQAQIGALQKQFEDRGEHGKSGEELRTEVDTQVIGGGLQIVSQQLDHISGKTDKAISLLEPVVRSLMPAEKPVVGDAELQQYMEENARIARQLSAEGRAMGEAPTAPPVDLPPHKRTKELGGSN
jgi:hypothetical protein